MCALKMCAMCILKLHWDSALDLRIMMGSFNCHLTLSALSFIIIMCIVKCAEQSSRHYPKTLCSFASEVT